LLQPENISARKHHPDGRKNGAWPTLASYTSARANHAPSVEVPHGRRLRRRDQRLTVNNTGRVVSQELQRNQVDLTQKTVGETRTKVTPLNDLKRKVTAQNKEEKTTIKEQIIKTP